MFDYTVVIKKYSQESWSWEKREAISRKAWWSPAEVWWLFQQCNREEQNTLLRHSLWEWLKTKGHWFPRKKQKQKNQTTNQSNYQGAENHWKLIVVCFSSFQTNLWLITNYRWHCCLFLSSVNAAIISNAPPCARSDSSIGLETFE